ncbi:hypothetical protein K0U00_44315, partial [Paenibacillus sepulcri]|nr:hypothetical protein [Paenibacillus sepulcri]
DEPIRHAAGFILQNLDSKSIVSSYPTGAGLPGHFYNRYESYSLVWPLLALSHYEQKYGASPK